MGRQRKTWTVELRCLLGNDRDLATDRREAQEPTMLALHLLQNTLVYI